MDADITTTGAVIDLHRIQKMIPHRYPMLMIERVIDVVPDVRAIGIKNVSINEWFFQGHFPAEPLMPGVLIIEAMAQTAAVLVVATLGPEKEGRLVYFMSVELGAVPQAGRPRRHPSHSCREAAAARFRLALQRLRPGGWRDGGGGRLIPR